MAARNEGGFQPPKVIEFVLQVRGIKELVAEETVYDFSPVRKIRAELEGKKMAAGAVDFIGIAFTSVLSQRARR